MAAVQINLLEEKEQKNRMPHFLIAGAAVVFLLIVLVFWLQAREVQEENRRLEEELAGLKATETEISSATDQVGTERQMLQQAVNSLEEHASVAELLKETVALLPERGYIEYFSLEDNAVITMDVRFDNLQETATYLDLLDHYERTSDVDLVGVTEKELDAVVDPFDYRSPYLATYRVELPGSENAGEEEEAENESVLEP
ncbi:hypothetical protein U0355_05850 [Salimicrobium sp. PL1-032A]|uniref:hypothetical protein n=1 Tax=Salimicrobium sp. PL1-032A TaxID=3095364 RepID=UPI003260E7EA